MHWYYDHEGTAEGPLDDGAMAALFHEGRVRLETLVWQAEMETWKDVSELKPAWAEKPTKRRSKTASVLLKLTGGVPAASPAPSGSADNAGTDHRKPRPMAPSGPVQDGAQGGLLKRLFKFGRKSD